MADNGRFVTFSAHLRRPMAEALQEEADDIGISRMALIQVILHEHLKKDAVAQDLSSETERSGDGFDVEELRRRAGFGGR